LKTGFSKTILPNGVRVISERVPSVGSVAVGVWVHVGSRDEPIPINGVAHFIEHLVFKGTTRRSALDIAETVESLGGSINAFTSREHTCYYVRIRSSHLPRAMEILGDILNNSRFAPGDLRKERQVILEEIKDIADTPGEYVYDLFVEQMFGSHPLGQPIMGKQRTVKSLRRPAVMGFLREHYCSPNVLVAATGDISHRALVDITRKHFGWPAEARLKYNTVPSPPGFSIRAHADRTKQTHVCLGVPAVTFSDPRRFVVSAINTYLSSGMSARLFQKVREEAGYCYNIYSSQEFFRDSGLVCIYYGADAKYVVKAANIILRELHLLKEKLLNRAQMGKIKEQLKGSLMLSQESMYNRMNRIAHLELLLGKFVTPGENCRLIDAIAPREIRDVANQLFDRDKLVFCSLGPTKRAELETIHWSAL